MTPHERRVRELEALRRVIADCESHLAAVGAIEAAALAKTFEQHTSALPAGSELRGQLERLALGLRRGSSVIAEARLRKVVASLRQTAENLARWVDARDAKLRARN